jgi:hypothetical protein
MLLKNQTSNGNDQNSQTEELKGINEKEKNIKSKYSFICQSEIVLKSILKYFKKNLKGIEKEKKHENSKFFNYLSFWHQKCIGSVLPFGYCDHKNYSLVSNHSQTLSSGSDNL